MALRQLTDLDTDKLKSGDRYSDGSAGAKVFNSTKTIDSTDGFYNSRITGSSGGNTASTPDLADGTYNLPCKIIQTQGTGANADPNNEYNFLISVSGGVATFRYNLTLTFNTGAQIVTSKPWSTVVVQTGVVISPPAWNGQKGGELYICASSSIITQGTGYFNVSGLGFRGGQAVSQTDGYQGEGYSGVGGQSTAANGNGGGGGTDGGLHGGFGGGSGASGGNSASGNNGSGAGSSGGGGTAGSSAGNSSLTSMVMAGAAGSGGAQYSGNSSGAGANSAGNIDLVARVINVLFHADGNNGGNATSGSDAGGGAGGTGGNVRCKGQSITFQSGCTATYGVGGVHQGSGADGATGVNGRVHADAPSNAAVSGSPTPAYTFTAQQVLVDTGGAFAFLIN